MTRRVDIIIPCLREPQRLKRLGRLVDMITEHTKIGYNIIFAISRGSSAYNKNQGLKMSKCQYVCFLDEDIIIKRDGWLGTMLETLEKCPKAGAIVPRLTFPDGRPQNKDSRATDIRLSKSSCSACLLCRRGIAEFDENFKGAWAEDEDFVIQLEAKGYKIYCDGRVNIFHLAQHNQPIPENERYLVQKWKKRRPRGL